MHTETLTTPDGQPMSTMAAFMLPNPPDGHGMLCVLDKTGDTKTVWDRRNEAEVAAAKAQFEALKGQGYLAFSVAKDGSKGEQIHEFDPDAEKIILSPPLVGG